MTQKNKNLRGPGPPCRYGGKTEAHQTLDVLVEGVEDHEDGRHVLVEVLHHRDRHRLYQVVPAKLKFEFPALSFP